MNNISVLPHPDLYASCPQDGLILEYYKGVFDSVFVLLHPFIKPRTVSVDLFKPSTYPDRNTIVNSCEGVTWSKVLCLTGMPSISSIDIGLRTQIMGLRKELENQAYANQLDDMCASNLLLPPDEGYFSDLLHDKVLQFILNLGHQWVWVGDEFCTERKLYRIDDLMGSKADVTNGRCNIFTLDKSLLLTTHWDSHFSFLCGSRQALSTLNEQIIFEGFFCDVTTEVYWSVRNTKRET